MANRTDPRAMQIHGTNPQFLIDKITRLKIHNDPYFKEKCFALTAETLVDRAVELKYIGGQFGGTRRPSKFLCLILKMLQIQPDDEIVLEFIKNKDYKYIRALGAFYWRLVGQAKDIYRVLEPLYSDYRRIVIRKDSGQFDVLHMDEFIDKLLRDDLFCDVTLPRISKRYVLEEEGLLEPYQSALNIQNEDLEEVNEQPNEEEEDRQKEETKAQNNLLPGRATKSDDWNKAKVTTDVVPGREITSKSLKKNTEKSSSSSSSSSRSHSNERRRKRDKKERRHRRRSYSSSDSSSSNSSLEIKKKTEEKGKVDTSSDQYWIELRKKLGMKI